MTREEQIKKESVSYNERRGRLNVIGGSNMLSEEEFIEFNKNPDFINGALWADEHPYERFVSEDLEKANKIYKGGKLMFVSVDEVERIKRQFINEAAELIKELFEEYVHLTDYNPMESFRKAMEDYGKATEDFRKAMEEQL